MTLTLELDVHNVKMNSYV